MKNEPVVADYICPVCEKRVRVRTPKGCFMWNLDGVLMKEIGVKKLPRTGWHWWTNEKTGKRVQMYPVCEKCYKKATKD